MKPVWHANTKIEFGIYTDVTSIREEPYPYHVSATVSLYGAGPWKDVVLDWGDGHTDARWEDPTGVYCREADPFHHGGVRHTYESFGTFEATARVRFASTPDCQTRPSADEIVTIDVVIPVRVVDLATYEATMERRRTG